MGDNYYLISTHLDDGGALTPDLDGESCRGWKALLTTSELKPEPGYGLYRVRSALSAATSYEPVPEALRELITHAVKVYPPALALALEDCSFFLRTQPHIERSRFTALVHNSIVYHLEAQRRDQPVLARARLETGPELHKRHYYWIVGAQTRRLDGSITTDPSQGGVAYVADEQIYNCELACFDIEPKEVSKYLGLTPKHYFARRLPKDYVVASCQAFY